MTDAWDEIDAWRKEQLAKLPPAAGPGECAETGEDISADRARTLTAHHRITAGFHPFGLRLREPRGKVTCGDCKHLLAKETRSGKRFFKCSMVRGDSNGPATDVRKKWPACERWEGKP